MKFPRPRNKFLDSDERSRAVALWNDGKDTADIAFQLEVHESVIYNTLARLRRIEKYHDAQRISAQDQTRRL